jgi:hypothetical protein
MIAEFCTWCREYIVNKNADCRECESCLKCQHFDGECCKNETVVSEYRKDWKRPTALGISPPLCRKYCPYLPTNKRRRAHLLFEGGSVGKDKKQKLQKTNGASTEKRHIILFTPLPKFWLTDNWECTTFEIEFSETIHYHMVLLGKCVWDFPEHITVEIPAC